VLDDPEAVRMAHQPQSLDTSDWATCEGQATRGGARVQDTAVHSRVPVAAHAPLLPTTGAFGAPFSMFAGGQTGELHVQQQVSLWWVSGSPRLTFTSVDGTDRCP
jgi:hypothetical protein